MTVDRPDAELLVALRTQPDLMGALYERHAPAVFRFLARRAGYPAAEDLLSDVFTAALGARSPIDLVASPALKIHEENKS
jgi:RNA polymerase sigma-70 factor (ECF subfamily)